MNKRTEFLASLGLLVGLSVAPVYGQAWGVRVKVPFRFVVPSEAITSSKMPRWLAMARAMRRSAAVASTRYRPAAFWARR